MQSSPVDLDREPLELLPVLASFPGAALVHVPDARTPVTVMGLTPAAELRIEPDGDTADPIAAIASFIRAAPVADLPFPLRGGIVGYLGYELGHWTVPHIVRRAATEPLAVLRRYDPLWIFDHQTRQWSRLGIDATDQLATLRAIVPPGDDRSSLAETPLTPAWSAATYGRGLQRIALHAVEEQHCGVVHPREE